MNDRRYANVLPTIPTSSYPSLQTPLADDEQSYEMDEGSIERISSRPQLPPVDCAPEQKNVAVFGATRHTLGLMLLLCVVFLWTLSGFLGSSIFADNTYAKPFFLTYLNTSTFMLVLIPTLLRSLNRCRTRSTRRMLFSRRAAYVPLYAGDRDASPSPAPKSPPLEPVTVDTQAENEYLGVRQTARLSLAFCILWFGANYFAMACLQHTSVASSTILNSTSSFWTLLIGALTNTERFTLRKLCGVLGSLVGIVLISMADFGPSVLAAGEVGTRALDPFPAKSPSEMFLGDCLALLSAVLYGMYTITLKKATLKALPRSLDMTLFFGLVGAFNFVFLLPFFPLLHLTGLETFELPPTRRVWGILLANSVSSLVSDICCAYAMVLTSPLVATVGLSLTIPLSLVGEMVLQARYEGWIYWVGVCIVVGSFVFVDSEGKRDDTNADLPNANLPHRHVDSDSAVGLLADHEGSTDGFAHAYMFDR